MRLKLDRNFEPELLNQVLNNPLKLLNLLQNTHRLTNLSVKII